MNRNAFFALLVAIGVAIIVAAGLLPAIAPQDGAAASTTTAVDLKGAGRCAFVPAPATARVESLPNLRFGQRREVPWSGPPARIAEWVSPTAQLLLVLPGERAGREALALVAPANGAMSVVGDRPIAQSMPAWSAGANALAGRPDGRFSALAAPRDPAQSAPAYFNPEVQTTSDASGARTVAWTSYRARFIDVVSGEECDLVANRVEDGADRPIVDARWSSDGRFLALLMLDEADRLGPTVLRLLDFDRAVWRDVDFDGRAPSTVNWIPSRGAALVTTVDLNAPDALDAIHVVDAASGAARRVPDAPELFAPAYWGVRFAPDGSALAAACVTPDESGMVTRGALCTWEVALR